MRVLKLGRRFDGYANFSNSQTPLDFDVLALDLEGFYSEFGYTDMYVRSLDVPDAKTGARLRDLLDRRALDIMEFLNRGRVLFMHVPCELPELRSGPLGSLGTAWRMVPALGEPQTTTGAGSSLELWQGADAVFGEFWQRLRERLVFSSRFIQPPGGTPWLRLTNTDIIVGAHLRVGPGHIVFIPDPREVSAAEWDQSLCDLARRLVAELPREELPEWAREVIVGGEREARRELDRRLELLANARDAADTQAAHVAELEKRKLLFTSTGEAFRLAVGDALERLGFVVDRSDGGRHDLFVESELGPAVVETKGVDGSAAEKHAAQLEKWVSAYYEDHGIEPKGILVVNAFRSTPFMDRTQRAFPDQMLRYAKSKGLALLTGVQLLGLIQEVDEDPASAERVRAELFRCVGEFPRLEALQEKSE